MDEVEFTEVQIFRLVFDSKTNSPIVLLQDKASDIVLPIWIGIFEAHAIAMKMEDVEPARPMTHDLLANTFSTMHALIDRVEVTDLVDNTYFARIFFQHNDGEFSLDSRPSDAIALALRTETPIFVSKSVMEKSGIDTSAEKEEGEDEEDEWTRILENYTSGGGDKLN